MVTLSDPPQDAVGNCIFGRCNHGHEDHNQGLCWKITQPDLLGFDKYCPCTLSGETHRLYETIGFTLPESNDLLIPKACGNCGEVLLLRIDEKYCNTCKTRL